MTNLFPYLYWLYHLLRPLFGWLGFLCAWALIGLVVWSLASSLRATWRAASQMHRVPCSDCQFFTNDYRLKCTVRPQVANTEAAIGCGDYCRLKRQ